MTKQLKADLLLVAVTIVWGVSYVPMDLALVHLQPFNLTALRFLMAFALTYALSFKKMRKISKQTVIYAAVMGFVLTLVYLGANYGVMFTSVSNAAFLCALAVVITPIISFFLYKKRPDNRLFLAIIFSLGGVGLMTLNGSFRLSMGDIFCIGCSVCYSIHLLVAERAVSSKNVNPLQIGVLQLGFCSIYNLILTFLVESPKMPPTPYVWGLVLFLAVFGTAFTFVSQVLAQRYTTASHVGVIFTLEPVFGAIAAFIILHESLATRAYFGAALLMVGLVVMELPRKKGGVLDEHSNIREE